MRDPTGSVRDPTGSELIHFIEFCFSLGFGALSVAGSVRDPTGSVRDRCGIRRDPNEGVEERGRRPTYDFQIKEETFPPL